VNLGGEGAADDVEVDEAAMRTGGGATINEGERRRGRTGEGLLAEANEKSLATRIATE